MENLLSDLTKEELIKVIAIMHDSIQEWDDGYGLPEKEAEILNKVGQACINKCVEDNNFDISQLLTKNNKWRWKMDYCKDKHTPPAQSWAWNEAEREYNKIHS